MKKIIGISLFVATLFMSACGGPCCTDGKCTGKCGNKTTQSATPSTDEKTYTYDCPMHCEGAKGNEPGKCPKCKMDLKAIEK